MDEVQSGSDKYMRYSDAAKYLHISEGSLRKYVQFRRVRFIHLGKTVVFSREDLDVFMESMKVGVKS